MLMLLPLIPVTTSPAAKPAAAAELLGSTAVTRMPPTASVNKLGVPALYQVSMRKTTALRQFIGLNTAYVIGQTRSGKAEAAGGRGHGD